MFRLRPFFKKLIWLLLEEVSPRVERDFIEFELLYYEAMFVSETSPKSVNEALDCLDLVLLHERDDLYYGYWPRLHELYRICVQYLLKNTAYFSNPIYGQDRFEENRVRFRREYKQRVLVAYGERNGYVIV